MSYYDEVAIGLYKEDYDYLLEEAKKLTENKLKDVLYFVTKQCEVLDYKANDKNYIILHWDCVNGWHYNACAQYVMSFLHGDVGEYADDKEKYVDCPKYIFLRLGEDSNDTEEDYNTGNNETGEDDYVLNSLFFLERKINLDQVIKEQR